MIGASARALVFSARRAGLAPFWIDLFGDLDLRAVAPGIVLPLEEYPRGFEAAADRAPEFPLMYTGGLENRPGLVRRLARRRPVWGNPGAVLRRVRSPWLVAEKLRQAGCRCPTVLPPGACPPRTAGAESWVCKPTRGAGGHGVHVWAGDAIGDGWYLQEYVRGAPAAALFLANRGTSLCLGMTRQLVGVEWLHAGRFWYCGSVGPFPVSAPQRDEVDRLGRALVTGFGLRGLFGVDVIVTDDGVWPVEVNPRYTASVEVLEYATGLDAVGLHRRTFDDSAPAPGRTHYPAGLVGKAIYFAPRTLVVPASDEFRPASSGTDLPRFADLPAAGTVIEAGRPVLTMFSRGGDEAACLDELRRSAGRLDHTLAGLYNG